MDIMKRGIILIVYTFVIVALYMFLSSPFDDIMTGLENINSTASDTQVEHHAGYGRTVFNMIFAILVLGPITWFIVDSLKREPDWGYR